jgi:hypothetical protein
MYLDDGLGGADTFEKCKNVSLVVKNDLFNFGFIIAEEKSNWNPVQESIWLGFIFSIFSNQNLSSPSAS